MGKQAKPKLAAIPATVPAAIPATVPAAIPATVPAGYAQYAALLQAQGAAPNPATWQAAGSCGNTCTAALHVAAQVCTAAGIAATGGGPGPGGTWAQVPATVVAAAAALLGYARAQGACGGNPASSLPNVQFWAAPLRMWVHGYAVCPQGVVWAGGNTAHATAAAQGKAGTGRATYNPANHATLPQPASAWPAGALAVHGGTRCNGAGKGTTAQYGPPGVPATKVYPLFG